EVGLELHARVVDLEELLEALGLAVELAEGVHRAHVLRSAVVDRAELRDGVIDAADVLEDCAEVHAEAPALVLVRRGLDGLLVDADDAIPALLDALGEARHVLADDLLGGTGAEGLEEALERRRRILELLLVEEAHLAQHRDALEGILEVLEADLVD